MTRWLFVRHAEAVSNAEGWLAGHRDAPLTEAGRGQARALARQIAALRPDRAVASDLARATETARLACPPDCPIRLDPGLRERHLGEWEGAPRALLAEPATRRRLLAWAEGPPGGESAEQVARRVLTCLASMEPGGTQVIVSHGTALRATLGMLDRLDLAAIATWRISNASLHVRDLPSTAFDEALHRLEEIRS